MNDGCYPSGAFLRDGELVIQNAPWQDLQQYIDEITNLPPSPNQQAQIILARLGQAAQDLKDVLPKANEMGNSLYNFGTTAGATLKGLAQLMRQDQPNKAAVEQLLGNLRSAASEAQEHPAALANTLTSFCAATTAGSTSLASLVSTATSSIAQANKTILATAKDLEQQLVAANLDVVATAADIQKIKQAAGQLAEIELDGPMFSVAAGIAAGVAAGTAAGLGVSALGQAWQRLVSQLTDQLAKFADANEAALKQDLCLSESQLTAAAQAWDDVARKAHEFMMNFYAKPEGQRL
jgi:hypothetical protein